MYLLVSQHVSGIIMPIIRRTVQTLQRLWCTALAVLQQTRGEEVVRCALVGIGFNHHQENSTKPTTPMVYSTGRSAADSRRRGGSVCTCWDWFHGESWFYLSYLVYQASLNFIIYFHFPILKDLMTYVSYCFISINNRLLVVKCYSSLVASGFSRN
jgi:hypothetical protein